MLSDNLPSVKEFQWDDKVRCLLDPTTYSPINCNVILGKHFSTEFSIAG